MLLFPLAGTLVIAFGFRVLRGTHGGLDRDGGDRAVLRGRRSATLISLQGHAAGAPPARLLALELRLDGRHRREDVDPRRPAVGVHDPDRHRGLDADPPLLDRPTWTKTGASCRFFAYLNFFVFSMLLLVLAGNFLLLIVGWAFVGAASYLLISFWYRRTTATTAGLKAFVINVVGDVGLVLGTYFIFKHTGTLEMLGTFHRDRSTARSAAARRRRPGGRLHPAARRRVREVRADPAAHLAARRDGRPDAGQRADPRRDDGHGRRLPDRAHAPAVRTRARRAGRRRDHRLRDAVRSPARSRSRRPTSSA